MEVIKNISLEKLEELLLELNFKIEKKLYKVEKPRNYNEFFRWGVKMTLVSWTDEYTSLEGILKTPIGQLSPDLCLQELTEKIFSGKPFEAFYRESKGYYRFVYENGKLEIKPVN